MGEDYGPEDTIRHTYFGGREFIPFEDFAEDVIQDVDEAITIGRHIANNPKSTYSWNVGVRAVHYAEFELTHPDMRDTLRTQIEAYEKEYGNG